MQLQKIEIGYDPDDQLLVGLKFYSKDGAVGMQTGWDWVDERNRETHTVYLDEGERVIGYKSRADPNFPNSAFHCDFQLIIGRLV